MPPVLSDWGEDEIGSYETESYDDVGPDESDMGDESNETDGIVVEAMSDTQTISHQNPLRKSTSHAISQELRRIPVPKFSIFEKDETLAPLDEPTAVAPVSAPVVADPRIDRAANTEETPETHFFPSQGSGDPDLDGFLAKASSGNGGTSLVDKLEEDLEALSRTVYAENNGNAFNINSSQQVALVLFGPQGGSTEKEKLEAKAAGGHRMSDLILQYRHLKREISKLKVRNEINDKGTKVRSASKVGRESEERNGRHYEQSTDPLILVDASAYIFRAYYSMPPMHRGDGKPNGAVQGFCKMLNRLALNDMLSGNTPRLVLVFDSPGKSFRSGIYPGYKGNRPDAPIDLIPQFHFVRQAATAYGIARIEAETYEADDVIATLAHQARSQGIDVNILSGDKDLMQLVTEKNEEPSIHLIDPATMARITHDEVVEKWGLPPSQLGDLLALAGDTADNIPGVPGIGPKIAAQLIQEYGTLSNLYENVDQVKQKARKAKLIDFREQALLSRELVELKRDVPTHMMNSQEEYVDVANLRMQPMDPDRIVAFYEAMGFYDIKRRFQNSLNRGAPQKKRPINSNKRVKATIPTPDEYEDVPF
jgi:5'-3' exonuclease